MVDCVGTWQPHSHVADLRELYGKVCCRTNKGSIKQNSAPVLTSVLSATAQESTQAKANVMVVCMAALLRFK